MLAWLVPAEPQALTAVSPPNKTQICWHGSGLKCPNGMYGHAVYRIYTHGDHRVVSVVKVFLNMNTVNRL